MALRPVPVLVIDLYCISFSLRAPGGDVVD
jgi:hypothetical protein